MVLQGIKPNLLMLLFGTFLAFLIIVAPHTARANDVCDPNGDFYTSYGNTHTHMATRLTAVHKEYLNNAISLNTEMYCVDTLLKGIDLIRTLTAGIDTWHALAYLLIDGIVNMYVMMACQIASSLLNAVDSLGKSLFVGICLPLPQLHLGLNFHIPNTCIGLGGTQIGAVGLTPMQNPPGVPSTSNSWQIWGNANSKFQVYVPKGP